MLFLNNNLWLYKSNTTAVAMNVLRRCIDLNMLINKCYLFNLILWSTILIVIVPCTALKHWNSNRGVLSNFLHADANDWFGFSFAWHHYEEPGHSLSETLSPSMTDDLKRKRKKKQSEYLASKLKTDKSCSPFSATLKIHTGLSPLRCWYFLKYYHQLPTNRDISCSKLSAVIACINHPSWREQMFRVWKSNTTI